MILSTVCFLAAKYARMARSPTGERLPVLVPRDTNGERKDPSSKESLTTKTRAQSLQRQHLGFTALLPSDTSIGYHKRFTHLKIGPWVF